MTQADKDVANVCAIAAWHGILAQPSRNDRGERTIILTAGPWTREIVPQQLQAALSEFRRLAAETAAA